MLLDWQKELLRDAYRLNPDGTRQHRLIVVNVARKAAKSWLGACVMLYHLVADPYEREPYLVSAANSRDQAKMVFDQARSIVRRSAVLSGLLRMTRDAITCDHNGGVWRIISSDANSGQGLSCSAATVDEYGFARDSRLFEAITLSTAARTSPIVWVMSTAGDNPDSPFARLCERGWRIADGAERDPTLFFRSWGPRLGDNPDYRDPDVWARHHPMWSVLPREHWESAVRQQTEAACRLFLLSQFVRGASVWLPAGAWESCTDASKALADGDPVVLGVDASWANDATGVVAVRITDNHAEPLGLWEKPAGAVDWRVPLEDVINTVRHACQRFHVRVVVCDPARFALPMQRLAEHGYPVAEFPNTLKRMVPAAQTAYETITGRGMTHNGDPRLTAHMGHVNVKITPYGPKITKEYQASPRKIDLAVCLVMALHTAQAWREQPNPYDQGATLIEF